MHWLRTRLFVLLLVPQICWAATDAACMLQCQQQRSSREYCSKVCSFVSESEVLQQKMLDQIADSYKPGEIAELIQKRKIEQERIDRERAANIHGQLERVESERNRIKASIDLQQAANSECLDASAFPSALFAAYTSAGGPNREKYNEWLSNAMPRISIYDEPTVFLKKVLTPDVIISTDMLDKIKGSKYAADLAWYFANHCPDSKLVSKMPTAQMVFFIDDLETTFAK